MARRKAVDADRTTGLKPAGYAMPAGIAMADRVLEGGSVDGVARRIAAHPEQAILARRCSHAPKQA
jgi:hypothetical protein